MAPKLTVKTEHWPIAGQFTIARGSRTEAVVVVVEISDGVHTGRGECVPYARYGETPKGVAGVLSDLASDIAQGADRAAVQSLLPAGAARNALDCALWDLEAKRTGVRVHELAGVAELRSLTTAYTLSLDAPEAMAAAAKAHAHRPVLKIKLGGTDGDLERLKAVRGAAPHSRLIVDANEGWSGDKLALYMQACAEAGVVLVEQPLPAGDDGMLRSVAHVVPVCADESLHDRRGLAALRGKYDAINIKLDKAGGLTEAFLLAQDAKEMGFAIMVGCMVGTSLAMAPALIVAQMADFVDLDGPLLLAKDREPGLVYDGSIIMPPPSALWG